MRKFTIQSRGDEESNHISQKIKNYLEDFGLVFDPKEPNIVISVGGDGTLLEAFHVHSHRLSETNFIGVHTGHLGFYADWKPDEIERLVIHIAKTPFKVVEYPLVEVTIRHHGNKKSETYLALNESSVKSLEGTVVMEVDIRGENFETFRGDGLCVSTPSGSTAYNKALGGAILHPTLDAMQIAEMASINNRVYRTIGSPLILPKHHTCLLRPMNDVDFQITVDHKILKDKEFKTIQFRVADETVRFARFRPFPFWNRVKESFITGTNE